MVAFLERMAIQSLVIHEVGSTKSEEIAESIIDMGVDMTLDMTTEMTFSVFDPDFKMLRNNYFQVRRPVTYRGYEYEIARCDMDMTAGAFDTVAIACRARPVQQMRRETGPEKNDAVSAAEYAKQKAQKYGLKMFIQESAENTSITRQQNNEIDESTWDVLQRLAADNQFVVFESYGVLYFSSEDFLIEHQPGIVIDRLADTQDAWYPFSLSLTQSDDDWAGSTFTAQVPRDNGMKLRPGMTVTLKNCGPFSDDRKHLITSITWAEGDPSPVAIQGRTLKETKDTSADVTAGRGVIPYGTRTLKEGIGSREFPQGDVKRLQLQLGILQSGIFDAKTKAAVIEWQKANGEKLTNVVKEEGYVSDLLTHRERAEYGTAETYVKYIGDGIIDDDDWYVLMPGRVAHGDFEQEGLPESISNPPADTSTEGALVIDDLNPNVNSNVRH